MKGKDMTANALQYALDTLENELKTANTALDAADRVLRDATTSKEAARVNVIKITAAIESIKKLIPSKSRVGKYMLPSQSGGAGHYIEKFSDGSYACTCQGFTYNGTCWAIKTIQSGKGSRYGYLLGDHSFDIRRDDAKRRNHAR